MLSWPPGSGSGAPTRNTFPGGALALVPRDTHIGLRWPTKCQTSRAIHSRAEACSGHAAPQCHPAKPQLPGPALWGWPRATSFNQPPSPTPQATGELCTPRLSTPLRVSQTRASSQLQGKVRPTPSQLRPGSPSVAWQQLFPETWMSPETKVWSASFPPNPSPPAWSHPFSLRHGLASQPHRPSPATAPV